MLRISERTRKIRHVPKVLYHQRRIPSAQPVAAMRTEMMSDFRRLLSRPSSNA